MVVHRKNSSSLIDRLILYVGVVVFISLVTPTTAQTSSNTECTGDMDLVFLLDASWSLTASQFDSIRTFTIDLYGSLFSEPAVNLKVGILLFATVPYDPPFSLTTDQAAATQYLNGITRDMHNYNTNTGQAMLVVVDMFATSTAQNKKVIIITDGEPNDVAAAYEAAVELKSRGIDVIVVSIGTSDIRSLSASKIYNVNEVTDDLRQEIVSDVCEDMLASLAPLVPIDDVSMDVYFAVDESTGNTANFGIMINSIKQIMNTFRISGDWARVAIFKIGVDTLITLQNSILINPDVTATSLYAAIDNLQINVLNTGQRNIVNAFQVIEADINTNGMTGKPVIVVFYMNGENTDEQTQAADGARRLQSTTGRAVYLMFVNIGSATEQWTQGMQSMAYNRQLLFQANAFNLLEGTTESSRSFLLEIRQAIYELATGTFRGHVPAIEEFHFDLIIAIDGSAAMLNVPHFLLVKTVIKYLISRIALGPARVAVILYDNAGPYRAINFGSYNNDAAVFNAELDSLPLLQRTATAGFNKGAETIIRYSNENSREPANTVALLFMLGTEENHVLSEAFYRAIYKQGIKLTTVILGNGVDQAQISALQQLGASFVQTTLSNIASSETLNQISGIVRQGASSMTSTAGMTLKWPDSFDLLILIHDALGVDSYAMRSTLFDIIQRYEGASIGFFAFGSVIGTANEIRMDPSRTEAELLLETARFTASPSGDLDVLLGFQHAVNRFQTDGRAGVSKIIILIYGGRIYLNGPLMALIEAMKNDGIKTVIYTSLVQADPVLAQALAYHPDVAFGFETLPFEYTPFMDSVPIQLARNQFQPQRYGNVLSLENKCTGEAGIMFLIDGSESMTDYFNETKRFVAAILSGLTLTNVDVGAVVYGTSVSSVLPLGEYLYADIFVRLVDLPFPGSLGTDPTGAFAETRSQFNNNARYNDPNVERFVVVVTDGQSSSRSETIEAANSLKTDDSVTILAIAIGDTVDRNELTEIVSEPSDTNLFYLEQADLIDKSVLEALHERLCAVIRPGVCEAGNYRDSTTLECLPCLRGYYQPEEEKLFCQKCLNEMSTPREQSTSEAQCVVPLSCAIGEYLSTSPVSCRPCPQNTYKDSTGPNPCTVCPIDRPVTDGTGSRSIDDCKAEQCTTPVDIVLVVDNSASILTTDFFQIQLFLMNLPSEFNNAITRFAIVVIGEKTVATDVLTFTGNIADVIIFVRNMTPGRLGTNTASALKMVHEAVKNDARDDTPVVALVITDGNSDNFYNTKLWADILKVVFNMKIIAVGVGSGFDHELQEISSPGFAISNAEYSQLQSLDIAGVICRAAGEWEPVVPQTEDLCAYPIDLMLVVDVSESASNQVFLTSGILGATEQLFNEMNGTPGLLRVGLISYSDVIDSNFGLSDSFPAVDNAIRAMSIGEPQTMTDLGLNDARVILQGSTREALKIMYVFTDGASSFPQRTRMSADEVKEAGIKMQAVAPSTESNTNRAELEYLSSTSQPIYYESHLAMMGDPDFMVENICRFKCPHPINVVFIRYFEGTPELLQSATRFASQLLSTFEGAVGSAFDVKPDTSIDTTAKAVRASLPQLEASTNKMATRVVFFMLYQEPADTGEIDEALAEIQAEGVVTVFMTPSTMSWTPSNANRILTNPGFNDPVVAANIQWDLCKEPCMSGYEMNSLNFECERCVQNTYRSNTESYQCVSCGEGRSTEGDGTTTSYDCNLITDNCFSGQEEIEDGTCRVCPKDTVREYRKQETCTHCPHDHVTRFIGSGSLSDCLRICSPGTFWNAALNGGMCQNCPENTYLTLPNRDYCAPCRPGYKSPAGSTMDTDCFDPCGDGQTYNYDDGTCDNCGENKYRNKNEGDNICRSCDSGLVTDTESAASADECRSTCNAGYWWSTDKKICFPCLTGFFQPNSGSFECIQCPPGTTSAPGSDSLTDCGVSCPKGQQLNANNNGCERCPLGTFKSQEGQGSCIPCSGGRTTLFLGADDSSYCAGGSCSAGQWRCRNNQCVPGSNRCNGLSDCTDNNDENGCECQAGNFYNSGSGLCEACPIGRFQGDAGQLHCFECPAGTSTSTTGATSVDDCNDICDDGHRFDIMTRTCVECEAGRFRKKNRDNPLQCISCPSPFTTNTPTADDYDKCISICELGEYYSVDSGTCVQCPIGYYQPEQEDEYECRKCTLGTSTTDTGSVSAAACTVTCPAGMEFSSLSGTTLDDCGPCQAGKYKTASMTVCEWCASGFTSAEGSDSSDDCYPKCEIGQEFNEDRTGCSDCRMGFTKDTPPTPDDPSCNWCDDGLGTLYNGSTSATACTDVCNDGLELSDDKQYCFACEIGSYRERFVDANCVSCGLAQTTVNTQSPNSSFCITNCPAGSFYDATSQTCQPCPNTEYQDEAGKASCKPCPDNTHTNGVDRTSIEDCLPFWCPAGTIPENLADPGNSPCVSCPANTYRGTHDTSCLNCPTGLVTVGQNPTACYQSCSVGQFVNTATNTCEFCPMNTYQSQPGQGLCTPCPNGQHTSGTGSTSVSNCRYHWCNAGFIQVGTGSVNCVACPLNTYRAENDPDCIPCTSPLITASTGTPSSDQCYANNCPPGSYLHTGNNTCIQCNNLTYQDESGQTSCKPCPNGFHTRGLGYTRRSDCRPHWCDAGFFQVGTQGKNCHPCPKHTYRRLYDVNCIPCPNGQVTLNTNSPSVSACFRNCSAGNFFNTATGQCEPCPNTQYQDEWGQQACKNCPKPGYHTNGVQRSRVRDCKADWCDAGTKLVGGKPNGVCVPCGYGFYRGDDDPECLACPSGLNTATPTAKSRNECTNVANQNCSSGFESRNGQCVPCNNGFYRQSGVDSVCVPCPPGFTTHRTAATNASQCIGVGQRCSSTYDLVIAVDLSRTSCNYGCLDNLKAWLSDLVQRLDVHDNRVRVGIIRYGSGTSRLIDLRSGIYTNRIQDLLDRGIRCSHFFSTNTHKALQNADHMFRLQSRSNCAKQFLLLTASASGCTDQAIAAARSLKSQNVRMTIICPDPCDISQISDNSSSLFVIRDYYNLPATEQIIATLC
ncbi:hypothetical protein ACF0H5_001013 [Mactra antiquata]